MILKNIKYIEFVEGDINIMLKNNVLFIINDSVFVTYNTPDGRLNLTNKETKELKRIINILEKERISYKLDSDISFIS